MDLVVNDIDGDACREYASAPVFSLSESPSPQSTSTIFSTEVNYPFQFFMDEQEKQKALNDRGSYPTPRSVANSMHAIDQSWSQKSDPKWMLSGSDSSSFFVVDTDKESDFGSNDSAPSTAGQSQIYGNHRSPRSLFGFESKDHVRSDFDGNSSKDYVLGGDNATFGSPKTSPPSSPTFSGSFHDGSNEFNSYPGIYDQYQANSYAAPLGNDAAIQIPRRRPAVVGLMKKADEGTPERSHCVSSPQHLNTYEKEYNMRFIAESERSPRMVMAAPELYSPCGYRSGSLPFATQQQPKLQKQHSSQQMSYSVPSQTLRVNGYPLTDTRKRCNSFSAQSMLPNATEGAYFHRQSYPSIQADRRISEAESPDHSQYMIEAQNQMRAQLLFQQQRMQDQHLQQQQLQQLHRLHTQQLKQAKQKSFEVKAQPERSVAQHRVIADGPIYQVQFKCSHRYMILGENFPQGVKVGSFVVVEADRGEDLGVVVLIAPRDSPLAISLNTANSTASKGSEGELKKILRFATPQERSELPNKAKDEMDILKICREWAPEKYNLSIYLVDAEYQFDRHKLVLYYSAARRIDFREFVRDLYAVYKTRIWMQPTDANSNFRPNEIAARALATGFLNQSPSSTDAGDMTFTAEYQSRLSAIALPPPVMSNGTAGEYGEHSLRSCPPSISTPTSSCADMNYWAPMAAQPAKGINNNNNNNNKQVYLPSTTRKVESAERLRQHVNTALYQQHQQLQYGSPHRPTTHY